MTTLYLYYTYYFILYIILYTLYFYPSFVLLNQLIVSF